MTYRLLVLSDTHCGHRTGLTPPEWQCDRYPDAIEFWAWYTQTLEAIGPVDACLLNGDLIDGKQRRSHGSEALTVDPDEQVDIALAAFEPIQARGYLATYGTPYHTSDGGTDWERRLARDLRAHIDNYLFIRVNNRIIKARHELVGSSGTPVGGDIGYRKQLVFNADRAQLGTEPLADLILCAHIHHHNAVMQARPGKPARWCISGPGMQGSTKFGARRCSGPVERGMLLFEIPDDPQEEITWQTYLMPVRSQSVLALH